MTGLELIYKTDRAVARLGIPSPGEALIYLGPQLRRKAAKVIDATPPGSPAAASLKAFFLACVAAVDEYLMN